MDTELVDLASLTPAEKNVRIHPDGQIAELIRAVEMFGQTRPMVVDEAGNVLVGNGLLTALLKMGHTQGSVLRMTGLSKGEKAKLMLSDNKIYSLGLDDYDGIMSMVRGVGDLDIPGFDHDILGSLMLGDEAATQASLDGFGRMTQEEVDQRNSARVAPVREGGQVKVTCPHCGKAFQLS